MTRTNWKKWLKAALIRSVKTMAQTAVALIGTNAIGVTEVDWFAVASAAVLAGIVSLLTSVAGLPEVEEE
ncbi:MAG: holin [Oscillospiraceae bacterium]|nr:holin [Oscillospiraceae bacterium]